MDMVTDHTDIMVMDMVTMDITGMAMDMAMDIMVTSMESKIYVCIKHCTISLPNTVIKLR